MAILPVKFPCTVTIIERGASLVLFLLQVMVAVDISLVSETTGFVVTNYGISFVELLGGFPLETVPFGMQYFWIWPFLTHL